MLVIYLNVHRLGQPEELLPLIRPYFLLQLISIIFLMIFNGFKQFFDGITDTITPMWIMLSANLINVIGNFILIFGYFGCPALGLTGAGIATLASRIYMLVVFAIIFFLKKRYRRYRLGYLKAGYNKDSLLKLNKMGGMIGLQIGMETALFSITAVMVGWLGTIHLAAHQVVLSISTVSFMIYYGAGAAISVRISHFNGRGEIENMRKASKAGLHIIMLLAVFFALFFFFTRKYIGYLFTSSDEVAAMVATLMIIVAFYQFSDGLQISFANSLRGIGDVNAMAIISLIGYFIVALPVSYLLGFVFNFGISGIWMSYLVGLTLTGLILRGRFFYILKK